MPLPHITKLEFRDYIAVRREGPFGNLVFAANPGPDAWEKPFRFSIDHGHGGALHNTFSIEQARELYRWLGGAIMAAVSVTEGPSVIQEADVSPIYPAAERKQEAA